MLGTERLVLSVWNFILQMPDSNAGQVTEYPAWNSESYPQFI
jgi:hypothetical protein